LVISPDDGGKWAKHDFQIKFDKLRMFCLASFLLAGYAISIKFLDLLKC